MQKACSPIVRTDLVGDSMPSAEGIRVSDIADLLEAVRRATKGEKQAFLASCGVKVLRATNRAMAQSLVERLPTMKDVALVAIGVWREYATDKERRVVQAAVAERKGPPRHSRPPCTDPFFLANGRLTRLGEFMIELISEETKQRVAPVPAVPPEAHVPGSVPQSGDAGPAAPSPPNAGSELRRDFYTWIVDDLWKRLRDHDRVKQERLAEAGYHHLVQQLLESELQQDASVYPNWACSPLPFFVDVFVKFKSDFNLPVGIEIKPPGATYDDLEYDLKKLAKMRKSCHWNFGLLLFFRATDVHDEKLLEKAEKLPGVYVRRVPVRRLAKSRD